MTIQEMNFLELNKISTHTPHTRHDAGNPTVNSISDISTHTPHTRHDYMADVKEYMNRRISTHTPHTRHDRKIYEHFTITPQHIGGLNDKFLSNWFFNQKILILLS